MISEYERIGGIITGLISELEILVNQPRTANRDFTIVSKQRQLERAQAEMAFAQAEAPALPGFTESPAQARLF